MAEGFDRRIDLDAVNRILGGGLIWLALAFVLLMAVIFSSVRVGRVTGEQVGVKLNRLNGQTTVVTESGVTLYFGLTQDFFVLDKTLQTLQMTGNVQKGNVGALKVKTVDGSDVLVDLKIQYRIVPDKADVVLKTSGPGDAYKQKWAIDYARSICRNHLGELTTEEFYDAAKRRAQRLKAEQEIKARLAPFGVVIDSIVIPRRPTFYQEYEEKIKEKKLADQTVLEEESKALAAKQKQETLRTEETNKKNVAIEEFKGAMQQLIIAEGAEKEKAERAADAYYHRVTIGAEAELEKLKKDAEGVLARKTAEAEGIEALKKALEGEGGRNMVKLEYARKLKNVTFSGKPFSVDGRVERFEHVEEAAASAGRSTKGGAK